MRLMSIVLPGVADVCASCRLPVSMLMSDDLPTLERPMKAYSCMAEAGHLSIDGEEVTKRAVFTNIVFCCALCKIGFMQRYGLYI